MAKPIYVFEYDHLNLKGYPAGLKESLDAFHGEKGVPYYQLTRSGVKFCNWVGVLQVGDHTIEVLPKIDRRALEDEERTIQTWQRVLIDMLRQSGMIETDAPTEAILRLKNNSILELYMELFLNECEYLLKRGLIKRYRKQEGNTTALKGALMFAKHLQHNAVHKERFYVRHTVYDKDHLLNRILVQTVGLISKLATSSKLKGRVDTLQLQLPELPVISVSEALFERIPYNRKSLPYKKAMEIAELLLLNFHPDIRTGRTHVLALMFDMNMLWEKWFARRLAKHANELQGVKVNHLDKRVFWKSDRSSMRLEPDVVVSCEGMPNLIIDTKWKMINAKPSPHDLRQMFAYNHRFGAVKGYLMYPGVELQNHAGTFYDNHIQCDLEQLPILHNGKLSDIHLRSFLHRIIDQE